MADKTQNVKTRLSFDGEAEYKAACKEINSTLKVLNSEMKLVTAEYKDNASSVDALKAKQTVLQKTYDEQAKKVKETEAALEKCRKATGDNSEESKKLETQLNYQKAALVKTEQELGKTTDEMEKAEKIKNVLFEKTEQNLEKYRDFHFGEFIEKPNQCGYFERNGNWYTYVIDERNFCTFTGPFNGSAIIYACSKVLHISKLFKEYKFTEQELEIYINNSFHSFGEIDKKSERHFDCK